MTRIKQTPKYSKDCMELPRHRRRTTWRMRRGRSKTMRVFQNPLPHEIFEKLLKLEHRILRTKGNTLKIKPELLKKLAQIKWILSNNSVRNKAEREVMSGEILRTLSKSEMSISLTEYLIIMHHFS
ncbi:hypothetical protein NPIL_29651 [Nephila pilipes]|uniref:Uncharacterized protein n=1 Tax=Nephila pilipes TaxID=299642 RepID=A0A8X6QPR3_NEPPI|nr:hypothetical protein NPIL_29651 [Nephila pilipes]